MSSNDSTVGSGNIGWTMFSEARERGRRKRAVLAGVRARSRGRERDDIEVDLRRSFAGAGIPQTPENLALQADLIADAVGPMGLLEKAVDALRTGPKPLGLRFEKERLAGDRWVPVIVADDPAARSTLRSWSTAHDAIKRNVTVDPDRGPGSAPRPASRSFRRPRRLSGPMSASSWAAVLSARCPRWKRTWPVCGRRSRPLKRPTSGSRSAPASRATT
ncbi:MAG TPA: hypothetical protein VGF84_05250 [Micromonosporaceae bacterium]|jgi:hypothetical protein